MTGEGRKPFTIRYTPRLSSQKIPGALPSSIAPAMAPAILAVGGGSYGVLYAVAGGCAVIGAAAVLPVQRVR